MSPAPIEYPHGITVHPILESFGAEVQGVDFSAVPLPDEVIKTLIDIQNRFAVTVFRDTGLDDDRHVAFSAQLGELEPCPKYNGPKTVMRFPTQPYLFDAGNMEPDGSIVKKDTRRWWYNKGNALWHTDSSFNQFRSKYSLLLAHEVPKEGGNTGFADVRSAYADLPEEKKEQLRPLTVEHNLWHSRQVAAPEEFKSVTHFEKQAKPPAFHKLVQKTPNGDETMFIAAHARTIVGWEDDKGLALINELLDHSTQDKYTFSLPWHKAGDLVWWDNRQSMHRATTFSDQMEKRDMRRTTVFDDRTGPMSEWANGVPEAGGAGLTSIPAA